MNLDVDRINPALADMVRDGKLSGAKLSELLRLHKVVDRFATRPHLADEEVEKLVAQFGVEPDVVSWSDYFQTEVASNYFHLSDSDFERIVDTVRFDLIAAVMIFQGKPQAFFTQTAEQASAAHALDQAKWTGAEEEAAHLGILMGYFNEMGLAQTNLAAEDQEWFQSFVAEVGVQAG